MIEFNMSKLVFEPIIPLSTMILFAIIMLVIILLNRRHIINRILIVLLLIIISQRPMIKDEEDDIYNWNFDILFVIDNTVSMNAVDVNNLTRLDAVKNDCEKIIDNFAGANFAIINFSNTAQLKYPFTKDNGKILDIIKKIKVIDPNYANGSSLDLPFEYMKMLLESSRTKDEHKTFVFFVSDGELNSEDDINAKLDKYKELNNLIDSGAVLGYGTEEGAKIRITESVNYEKIVDSEGYLINADTSSPYISRINEENLKLIAKKLEVDYYHMTDYSVIEDKITNLKKEVMNDKEKVEKKIDIYYYFSGALVIILLLELLYYRRNVG